MTAYYGGIGTQYGRLAPALAALGHELHVILSSERPTDTVVAGVHVHPLERPRLWPWFELAWARLVGTKIDELGPFDQFSVPSPRRVRLSMRTASRAGRLTTSSRRCGSCSRSGPA